MSSERSAPVVAVVNRPVVRLATAVAIATAVMLTAGACSDSNDVPQGSAITNPVEASGAGPEESTTSVYNGYRSPVYADNASWLCRPDSEDVCDDDLTVEVISADGQRSTEIFTPADDPGVDCFYVYPTVSNDPSRNSDLIADGGEVTAVRSQAARLAQSCRVWAPMYQQATLGNIASRIRGDERSDASPQDDPDAAQPSDVAYATMLDAFRHYMANDNNGRGIVLVGHSQGTGLLARLLTEEFPEQPQLNNQLVSAILAGLSVPEDAFDGIGVCTSATDTGCFLAWASYRSDVPPANGALFGRNPAGGRAACTNPADLTGGSGPVSLTAIFEAGQAPGDGWIKPEAGSAPQAPWVALPGLVTGECVERDGYHFMEVTVVPDDVRTSDVPGDLTPQWGLHLVDMNLVMGDLTPVVDSQARRWLANR